MKKTLCLLLLLVSATAFACTDSTRNPLKWSVGVIGYGHLNMAYSGMQHYFMPGIQFAHNNADGKWSQRVAFEFTKQVVSTPDFPPGSADIMFTEGKENRALLRFGLERGWNVCHSLRPYAAIDLAGQLTKSDITYSGGFAGLNQREQIERQGFGLMPAVGLKAFLGKHISVYAEYRAEAMLSKVNRTTTYYNGYVDARPYREMDAEFDAGTIFHSGIQVFF